MRCLYITQEYAPLFAESGLGLTSRALPIELQRGHAATHDVILPYYPRLVELAGCRTEVVCTLPEVTIGQATASASVRRLVQRDSPCEVFLVHSDPWYDRAGMYRDEHYVEYPDAVQRAAFFGWCVAAWVSRSGRSYDIVHGNDWQSGAALAHLRAGRHGPGPRLLMNIHSAVYTGRIDGSPDPLGLPPEASAALVAAAPGDDASLLLLGLLSADAAVTCSPTYAAALPVEFRGTALGAALAALPLHGIVSGVDYGVWNPMADGRPSVPFDATTVAEGKRRNTYALQRATGLAEGDIPVLGTCSRLVEEKGIDALLDGTAPLLRAGRVQLVLVGPATDHFQRACAALSSEFPHAFAHLPRFDQDVAWLVYAGSDFTLMPSRVEPCGLNQLVAMAYGTLPIATHVGGLVDTIVDLRADPGNGTGLFLAESSAHAVERTVSSAIQWLRARPDEVLAARRQAMGVDWSWRHTATSFARLYRELDGAAHSGSGPR